MQEQTTPKQAHTPEPWRLEEFIKGSYSCSVVGGPLDDPRIIAEMVWAIETVGWTPEDEANARLIVASPALLEALEAIAERPEGAYHRDPVEYRNNVISWCQDTANAAIAKARGD